MQPVNGHGQPINNKQMDDENEKKVINYIQKHVKNFNDNTNDWVFLCVNENQEKKTQFPN